MPPYSGSPREYDAVVERGVEMRARDGVTLVSDVYRPGFNGQAVEGSFPTIVERTPYGRGRKDLYLTAQFFASRGYNVVMQDCRGRFDSEGEFEFFFGDHGEGLDGYDTIEWIAGHEWSDGKVATTGLSFTGANQQALAVTRPPHLTTQVILDGGYNYWKRTLRENGAFRTGLLAPAAVWMAIGGREAQQDLAVRRSLEDAYRNIHEWVARLPWKRGDSPLAAAPSYEDWYFKCATHGDYQGIWRKPMPSLEEFVESYPDIPVLLVTSWYGHHQWANFAKFNALSEQNARPVKLVVGTWTHHAEYTDHQVVGEVDFGNEAALGLDEMRLRWFDLWLKGHRTGVEDDPPIRMFVMGGGTGARQVDGAIHHGGTWRSAPGWPLATATELKLFLHQGGGLTPEGPGEHDEPQRYVFDPGDPVPTLGGGIQDPPNVTGLLQGGPVDQRARRGLVTCADDFPLASRHDVLVFRTAPLESPVEVVGPLHARLWVSSSSVDTDFTIKLIDEYPASGSFPEGFAMNLCDTIMRMRYRNGRETGELIQPGEVYEVTIGPLYTANVFGRGHRIRLDVSSSNFPHFDVNPNTGGAMGESGGGVVALNTVFVDADRPSHLLLATSGAA